MKRSTIIFASCVIGILAACTKESTKNAWSTQESRIETFVDNILNSDSTTYAVYNNGSVRVVVKDATGEGLSETGTISFYYAGYVMTSTSLSSTNLFATNYSEIGSTLGYDQLSDSTAMDVLTVRIDTANFVEGLYNGLLGVKGGEECYILFSGKYGFGQKALGTIPANSALAYHIWVESISND